MLENSQQELGGHSMKVCPSLSVQHIRNQLRSLKFGRQISSPLDKVEGAKHEHAVILPSTGYSQDYYSVVPVTTTLRDDELCTHSNSALLSSLAGMEAAAAHSSYKSLPLKWSVLAASRVSVASCTEHRGAHLRKQKSTELALLLNQNATPRSAKHRTMQRG